MTLPETRVTQRHDDPHFTPRQRQVLDLLVLGYTNPQVAEALGVSLDGAKWHVREILSVLDVESREQAAEFWREFNGWPSRFRRFARAFVPGALAARIAIGTAVVAVVAGATVVALLLRGGDDEQTAAPATETPVATTSPVPTPSASATATASARPAAAVPTRQVVPRGGSAGDSADVLFLDPATGGGEVWDLPGDAFPIDFSPRGRYVVWSARDAATGRSGSLHLLDTHTGTSNNLVDAAFGYAAFSPDETRFVLGSENGAWLYDSASLQPLLTLTDAPTIDAEWSPTGTHVFVTGNEASVLFDGQVVARSDVPATGAEWSPDGSMLAIGGADRTRIVDVATGAWRDLPASSTNPRWSFDGRYLGTNGIGQEDVNPLARDGIRVFDVRSGEELLRVHGAVSCFGRYMAPDGDEVFGTYGPTARTVTTVRIPSGELAERESWGFGWRTTAGHWLSFGQNGETYLEDSSGARVAEVNAGGSVPYDSDEITATVADGRAILYPSVGGRGLCGEGQSSEEFRVSFPPFAG